MNGPEKSIHEKKQTNKYYVTKDKYINRITENK